jgi:hypothetical protein
VSVNLQFFCLNGAFRNAIRVLRLALRNGNVVFAIDESIDPATWDARPITSRVFSRVVPSAVCGGSDLYGDRRTHGRLHDGHVDTFRDWHSEVVESDALHRGSGGLVVLYRRGFHPFGRFSSSGCHVRMLFVGAHSVALDQLRCLFRAHLARLQTSHFAYVHGCGGHRRMAYDGLGAATDSRHSVRSRDHARFILAKPEASSARV